jgi:hypothetical protein
MVMSDDVLESEMFGGSAEALEMDDTGRTYPVKRDLVRFALSSLVCVRRLPASRGSSLELMGAPKDVADPWGTCCLCHWVCFADPERVPTCL